jgi:hypothetical protein
LFPFDKKGSLAMFAQHSKLGTNSESALEFY